ncbi:T9SS type A sorting domain-containing protein [Riemerella columbina]|uniref:T9SS type A sorting domain-containing protein n=1 Tax=Riemerella columbina TaxID=103810 RepID=UPI00266EB949|nr:T9SS type A sorting domain-containing protein [Riemerella columbina]WKS94561.1 T9SS type A sorting domain-containing protein [Riemerella columbina]
MRAFLFLIIMGFSFLMGGSMKAQSYTNANGFQQKSDDGVLVAYPNPAKDFIILKTKNPQIKIKAVTFYSIIGVEVMGVNLNASYSEVRLDRLKPGKYLLKYTLSDNTQKVTQIIKQ